MTTNTTGAPAPAFTAHSKGIRALTTLRAWKQQDCLDSYAHEDAADLANGIAALDELSRENAALKEALRFYADQTNYRDNYKPSGSYDPPFRIAVFRVLEDAGDRARTALKEAGDE